jgi:hypothetical protein
MELEAPSTLCAAGSGVLDPRLPNKENGFGGPFPILGRMKYNLQK